MKSTAGLVLLLIVSQGVSEPCDGRKEGAECYGQLDGEIEIKLMDITPPNFNWNKGKTNIYKWRNGSPRNILSPSKVNFESSKGTMKIINLYRNDSGSYTVTMFDDQGQQPKNLTMELIIQAPVTDVRVVPKCVDGGEMLVSCTSKGDNLQYSWSLNGKQLPFQASNITLNRDKTGQLVCHVKNNVSEKKNEVRVSCVFIKCSQNGTLISDWFPNTIKILCDKPILEYDPPQIIDYLPIMGGILSALLLVLILVLAVAYIQKKKQSGTNDEQELTYADVRIVNQPRRSIQVKKDLEIEYGQVKFSERARRSVAVKEDPRLYAQVRRNR
ncbi:T-cell surface antigen CD2 [Corythoichthys intestinalis]|uniref:T-cell surface antigen CD2 n=1 Tax=Corythoichthys intestinalis TaxID=161448 RepID=UPI0025A4DD1E|nr:T-cell surface antigen CD2 [Corythoichthys intestinalis]